MDNRQSKKAKQYADKLSAYKSVFMSPDGEKVLLDMMSTHGFMGSTFNGDVNQMLIKEGERNVVLRIMSILKMDVKAIYERIDREAQSME